MILPKLEPADFLQFFVDLHGYEPFLWQKRLAETVFREGWPRELNLPTGSGKTAVLDIAIFHLALDAQAGDRRRAPMRIAFVVDRRLIVDAAHERAELIRDRLLQALKSHEPDSAIYRVARRLESFSGEPLIVRALRGGVPREHDWARTPSQPTVLCSTVDQVGSRLLFRGYGVSDSMRPVHAGLIGSDCLILLDEAHLSEPFRQTLSAIARYRRPPWTEHEPAPWNCVTLSATPNTKITSAEVATFSLREDERADVRLAPRLSVSKPALLVSSKTRSDHPVAHAQALVGHAWELSGVESKQEPRVIAIVVNRVALARRCHQEITSKIRQSAVDAEAVLFIGRNREVDRAQLMKRYLNSLISNRDAPARTLFVVATQSIEAGADFDFDALVTQIAPLDALRQRFGRLNRMGRPIEARAVILACQDEVRPRAEDPLYGVKVRLTWEWLAEQAQSDTIDFGINAMDQRLKSVDVAALSTDKRNGPVVMPAYVDLWAQTSPIPAADPEPSLFLHGASEAADVQIVWRADLQPSDLTPEARERTLALLSVMPPRAAETVAVPIAAARAWLQGSAAVPVNDVEGASLADYEESESTRAYAFRWRGAHSESSMPVRARDLRPGDVIVVSSVAGGCDDYGWHPVSDAFVRDVADQAARPYAQQKFVLRLHRRLLENELRNSFENEEELAAMVRVVWSQIDPVLQEGRNGIDAVLLARRLLSIDGLPGWWRQALEAISKAKSRKKVRAIYAYDDDDSAHVSGIILVAPDGVDLNAARSRAVEDDAVTDEDDAGSFRRASVELTAHAVHVQTQAREFAERSGIVGSLLHDVQLAAFLHDEGKRDARFQLYLRRGDALQSILDQRVLAKSGTGPLSRVLDATARRRAGLPDRWRHEADSVRRALQHPRFQEADDKLLVLWLIGTHHGYGRPLYPHNDPHAKGPQDLDFQIDGIDWPQIFSRLLKRYGPWELARLEAMVRLADHRASAYEELMETEHVTDSEGLMAKVLQ